MEKWFKFTAYNSQAVYGIGTEAEADKYCDILNSKREINVYSWRELDGEAAKRLDSGDDTDGFRLDVALDACAE